MKFGVLGEKLGHSLSPVIHRSLFDEAGVEAEYMIIERTKDELTAQFSSWGQIYKGMNITIPYKEVVVPWLTEISREAAAIGAINTIKWCEGQAKGYNTDYYGFGRLLESNRVIVENRRICVLGSGGAAQAVVKYLLDKQAAEVIVVARQKLATAMKMSHLQDQNRLFFTDYNEVPDIYEVLVNTTPVGMYPDIAAAPLRIEQIKASEAVVDLIYNPSETLLMRQARQLGIPAFDGLLMLVAQAAAAQEIWFGHSFSDEIVQKITLQLARELL